MKAVRYLVPVDCSEFMEQLEAAEMGSNNKNYTKWTGKLN
jgi:hypothetical protein